MTAPLSETAAALPRAWQRRDTRGCRNLGYPAKQAYGCQPGAARVAVSHSAIDRKVALQVCAMEQHP
jgi:hypothetical protein